MGGVHCMKSMCVTLHLIVLLHDACLVVQVWAAIACAEGVNAMLVCKVSLRRGSTLQASCLWSLRLVSVLENSVQLLARTCIMLPSGVLYQYTAQLWPI